MISITTYDGTRRKQIREEIVRVERNTREDTSKEGREREVGTEENYMTQECKSSCSPTLTASSIP